MKLKWVYSLRPSSLSNDLITLLLIVWSSKTKMWEIYEIVDSSSGSNSTRLLISCWIIWSAHELVDAYFELSILI
jgi:hypothetical protein